MAMRSARPIQREVLPIPDVPRAGLVDLPQGVDCGHATQDAVAARRREGARVRRRHLGALRHRRGLDAVRGPVRATSREDGALVAEDYPVPNAFTGEINWVEIDVGDAAVDGDHRLEPDELLRVAMARQ